MAFEDRDTVVSKGPTAETAERVIFERDRSLPGVPLRITVEYLHDGIRKASKTVPQSVVDTAWPGTAKTLKAHLLSAIDAAL